MNYLFVSSCYTLITISIQSSVSIRFYYVAIAQQNKYQRNVTVYQKISYRSNNDYEKSADYIVSMIMIIILRRFYRLTFLKEEQRLYDHESSSLSLLLHQIFTLAKIFLPHILLIKLRFPLCSLSQSSCSQRLVFAYFLKVVTLFCIRAQIMCSYPAPASQPHQIFSPATRLHCAGFTTMSRVNIPII